MILPRVKDMVIGIDLDSTLVDTESLITKYRKKHNVENLEYDWKFTGYPEEFKKDIYEAFKSEAMNCLPVFKGVPELLKKLWEDNTIYIITARAECIRAGTLNFIEKDIKYKDGVFFVDVGESKKDIFKKLKLDMWIDDAPHDLLTAKGLGIYTVMISNESTPYNHYIREHTQWFDSFASIDFFGEEND